jgi:hypothetical protein
MARDLRTRSDVVVAVSSPMDTKDRSTAGRGSSVHFIDEFRAGVVMGVTLGLTAAMKAT